MRRRRRARTRALSTNPRRRRRALRANPRRRRRATLHANPRRRYRRRRAVAMHTNPRRRHAVARRRYRRNPGLSARGIVSTIKQGAFDGARVVLGQIAVRKVSGLLAGILPASIASGTVGGIVTRLGAAVGTAVVANKVAPNHARMIAAGAFAEAISYALAQNTSTAGLLSAYPARPVIVNNGVRGRGMRAYPRAALQAGGMPVNRGVRVAMPTVVG